MLLTWAWPMVVPSGQRANERRGDCLPTLMEQESGLCNGVAQDLLPSCRTAGLGAGRPCSLLHGWLDGGRPQPGFGRLLDEAADAVRAGVEGLPGAAADPV